MSIIEAIGLKITYLGIPIDNGCLRIHSTYLGIPINENSLNEARERAEKLAKQHSELQLEKDVLFIPVSAKHLDFDDLYHHVYNIR